MVRHSFSALLTSIVGFDKFALSLRTHHCRSSDSVWSPLRLRTRVQISFQGAFCAQNIAVCGVALFRETALEGGQLLNRFRSAGVCDKPG